MELLERSSNLFPEVVNRFPSITQDKIASMSDKLKEADRANNSFGRMNTQFTNQLLTLTMSADSPYRVLRQCLAEIESRRKAIESAYFQQRGLELELEELKEAGDPKSLLRTEQNQYDSRRNMMYLEGAFKEIGIYQEAYDDVREAHNIPEDWDEEDFEKDEPRHNLRMAFRQAHRDKVANGRITPGNAEWLTQLGVHIQVAENVLGNYILGVAELIAEGKIPTTVHFEEFLDHMLVLFGDAYKEVADRMGLKSIIRKDLLYLEKGKDR